MTTNRADVSSLISQVSFYLRDRHQLKRLQSEWLCFRFIGTILSMDMEDYPAIRIAERLFMLWSVPSLTREFDLLFSSVLREFKPPTEEQRKCLPTSNISGLASVPNGTKGKSRRNN